MHLGDWVLRCDGGRCGGRGGGDGMSHGVPFRMSRSDARKIFESFFGASTSRRGSSSFAGGSGLRGHEQDARSLLEEMLAGVCGPQTPRRAPTREAQRHAELLPVRRPAPGNGGLGGAGLGGGGGGGLGGGGFSFSFGQGASPG